MALTELVPRPAADPPARRFAEVRRGGIADASPAGRIRLDAIARWLQDVAWADVADALGRPDPWIVRRQRIRVAAFPAFAEEVALETWCSATGPAIAERRTSLRGPAGAHVEAVALWVRLDPVRGRPMPLDDAFEAAYGAAAGGRRARSRLRHPAAPAHDAAASRAFAFRAADLDQAGHVNNAAYWAVLEEELAGLPAGASLDAEVEHRGPGVSGPASVVAAGPMRWILGASGEVVASFELG